MSEPKVHYEVDNPRIVLLGQTGAGKSSLTNALLGEDAQRIGVRPTTQKEKAFEWSSSDQQMYLVDTPGIMEEGKHLEFTEALFERLSEAHVILWVIGYPNRSIDSDKKTIQKILEVEAELPVIIVGSGIDRVSRDFTPSTFNLDDTSTPSQNLKKWKGYLEEQLQAVGAKQVVLCSAGEGAHDTEVHYNLKGVHDAIEEVLPDVAKLQFIRKSRVKGDNDYKAAAIIGVAVTAASAAAAIPIPLADAIPITTAQVAMIVSLSALHGQVLSYSTAGGLVVAAVAAVAGPMIFQQVVKLIPGVGSVVGAALAGTITLAVGTAVHTLLKNGIELTPESLKEATLQAYKKKKKSE